MASEVRKISGATVDTSTLSLLPPPHMPELRITPLPAARGDSESSSSSDTPLASDVRKVTLAWTKSGALPSHSIKGPAILRSRSQELVVIASSSGAKPSPRLLASLAWRGQQPIAKGWLDQTVSPLPPPSSLVAVLAKGQISPQTASAARSQSAFATLQVERPTSSALDPLFTPQGMAEIIPYLPPKPPLLKLETPHRPLYFWETAEIEHPVTRYLNKARPDAPIYGIILRVAKLASNGQEEVRGLIFISSKKGEKHVLLDSNFSSTTTFDWPRSCFLKGAFHPLAYIEQDLFGPQVFRKMHLLWLARLLQGEHPYLRIV